MSREPESGAGRRCRVLLVDDNGRLRQTLRELLEDEHDVVEEAADGETGVAMAERLQPDVILMDYRMPGMNGLEATRAITGLLPETQVILLTAYDEPNLRQDGLDAGVCDYLPKGGSSRALMARIGQAFDVKRELESRR
jgi:CheY-like chemotaxis protein